MAQSYIAGDMTVNGTLNCQSFTERVKRSCLEYGSRRCPDYDRNDYIRVLRVDCYSYRWRNQIRNSRYISDVLEAIVTIAGSGGSTDPKGVFVVVNIDQ